jgi:hypothetical protein
MATSWFNQNPQVTPIPPSGAWIYPMGGNASNLLNATTTNSSTTVTINSPGTTMLAVGQPISGLNILANSFITVVGSTTVTINQATASSGAATGNVVTPNIQAGAVGSTTQNAAPFGGNYFYGYPSAAALALDTPGCPFFIPEAQTIIATFNFIPAPGVGIIGITSGTTAAQIQYLLGPTPTWTTFYTGTASATSYFKIETDGGNVRVNFPTTGGSFIYYRFRGLFPTF